MLLLALLTACGGPTPTAPVARPLPQVEAGAPVAGMAEGFVELPVGVPLGGYTGRCKCFGGEGEYDDRRSAYTKNFNPSIGVQTQPKLAALWLENGDQDLLILKTDAIYTFEGMIQELEERLGATTQRDLGGKIVLASNHSHSAPANFDRGVTWFLGGDRFNREVFERIVGSIEDVAMEAFETREPAAIGIGQAQDWDPDDRVYRDRRGDNDELVFFDDIPPGKYKDPNLTVLRVDTAAGEPMGMFFAFGMHGTVMGGDNQLWSYDAPGGVEAAVEERFDTPVVVGFMQHGGGDASPAGRDDEFARLESLGEYSADAIMDLYNDTPTSSDPIRLETVTRSIDTSRDVMQVHRPYGVLEYAPYNPDEDFLPDEILYEADGTIATPIDEFNTQYGGAFCGEDIPLIPGVSIGTQTYPYNSCVDVEVISSIIGTFFGLEDGVELPLSESLEARTTATRLGPVPIREPSGEVVTDDVLMAFFPGETTAMFTEQFRRRAADELGFEHAIPFGYAQDHEGYLLIPEDWLKGGYEPNINIWGPLHGEHIMEGVLTAADEVLSTDTLEPYDAFGYYADTVYDREDPLLENQPDDTPLAGTALDTPPEYFLVPLEGLEPVVSPPSQVRRIQDVVQFMWDGGDPGVDLPEVYLERLEDGAWTEVLTEAGRPVSSPMHDILMSSTADPLYPFEVPQSHVWWIGWQAVPHVADRAGLPEGTYRFQVYGQRYTGGATTWPWPSEVYELTSAEFEVVPADITLSLDGDTLSAHIDAPAAGFRLIDMEGDSRGANPARDLTATWTLADGTTVTDALDGAVESGMTQSVVAPPDDAVSVEVVDGYGNVGTLALD
jgi:neutral ceramidase